MEFQQIKTNISKPCESSLLKTIKLCRLCLASLDTMIELFSTEAKLLKINDKLKEFCHLGISEADVGPKTICFTCLNEVNRFADFFRRVQDNQKLLALSSTSTGEHESSSENEVVVDSQETTSGNDKTDVPIAIEVNENESGEDDDAVKVEIIVEEEDEVDEMDENFTNDGTYNKIEIDDENLSGGDNEEESLKTSLETKVIGPNDDEMSTPIAITEELKAEQDDPHDIPTEQQLLEVPTSQTQNNEETASNESNTEPTPNSDDAEAEKRRYKKRLALDKPIREFFDLRCDKCNKNFQTFQSIKHHMTEQHGERFFFVCCDREFYRRDTVMEHINLHQNPQQYKCEICQQICKSKVTLKVHMKQHIPKEQQPFPCEICGCRFAVRSQLKSHMNTHLSTDQRKFVCDECGKAFAFKFVLDKHKKRMHIGQKNFMCEICAKSFVDKVNLATHKRIHDTTLPRLECPQCNALLKSRKTLQVHMRVHETTEYSCEICMKLFPTKNGLLNHMQYYHADKKYPCETCGRVFKKSLNLKEHMATHTGEVLYKCEYCDKTFNAKANRYAHIKKVHPAEWSSKQKLRYRVDKEKLAE